MCVFAQDYQWLNMNLAFLCNTQIEFQHRFLQCDARNGGVMPLILSYFILSKVPD